MNRFNDVQASTRSRRPIAITEVGGQRHDVSNLCLLTTEFVGAGKPRSQSHQLGHHEDSRPQRVRPRQVFRRLYPDTHALPDIPVASLVFSKTGHKDADATQKSYPQQQPNVTPNKMTDRSNSDTLDPVADDDDLCLDSDEFERPLIEVSPGCRVELRGSDETWSALQRGFSRQLQCPCCSEHLLVIRNAAMVLCPDCRMIVPIDDNGRGMGLGVRMNSADESIPKQQQGDRKPSLVYAIKDPPKRHDSLKDSNHSVRRQRTPTTMLGPKAALSKDRPE